MSLTFNSNKCAVSGGCNRPILTLKSAVWAGLVASKIKKLVCTALFWIGCGTNI